MLYDPAKHEPLRAIPWDERRVRAEIERIVADTESHFTEEGYWPLHPLDREGDEPPGRVETPLYHGACGVLWALHYLQAVGAADTSRHHLAESDRLLARHQTWLGQSAERDRAGFISGNTPILMMAFGEKPSEELESALEVLLSSNRDHPSRDLLCGAAGTLLAASFLYERTGDARWAESFRATADTLWFQLEWSPQHRCSYWTQRLDGRPLTCLGAMHGFVGVALPILRGLRLLDAGKQSAWEQCIVGTVRATANHVDGHVNWHPQLDNERDARKKLLQFCHGAPGFVICLAGLSGNALDDLLLAAGETIWSAGPLGKGSGLCHGTAGNGYALLKLYDRTGDAIWLDRARAFAMHGIARVQADASKYGQSRYSLWSGDLGFAIYLWDCLRARAQFPTLDVFYP